MSYDDNQIEFPLPGDKPEKRESARHLPKYFRTEKNRKFLQATLDQMLQPGVAEKVNSFVGRKTAKAFRSSDNYLAEVSKDRENYQLEPVSIIKDNLGNVNYLRDYTDFINQINNFNGVNNNHGRNTKEEFYSWDPHIDWDKFTNFREYYWLPNGPETVVVPGEQKEITSTYTVTLQEALGDYSYIFTPDGATPNPSLKLYRGVKYRFEIDTPGLPLTFRTARTLEDEFLLKDEVSAQTVENGVIELILGPETPDQIFYVADNDINLGGIIKVANQSEATFIDVESEIIGKKFYTTRDGWSFSNGLKIRFEGEVLPAKYANLEWFVEGVGSEIKLVSDIDVEVSFPVGIDLEVPFDGDDGFDRLPFDTATGYPRDKDYITINRASSDGNFWSRYNRWFHREVIELASQVNGTVLSVDQTARANRPIIEFEAGLKLYNFGTISKQVIDLMDDFTTDAFSTIEGSLGYNIDGVQLTSGMRVLFLNDPDPLVRGRIFEVKFINFKGSGNNGQITLVEAPDSLPVAGENILVTKGNTYSGKIWYYDGENWNLTQEKVGVNQAPVFDVFDENEISFSNTSTYPSNSFRGTKIFSFKEGTGSADSVLGFPLSYRSIDNVGDIVFNFDYNIDKFQYQINDVVYNKKVKSGFLKRYKNANEYDLVGVYTKADRLSEQKVILQYINDGTRINYPINCFEKSASLDDLKVSVYVNNKIQKEGTDYEIANTNDNTANVRFLITKPADASIILECSSKAPKTANGYYEIASNLEKNPLNDDILTFTLGEVSDHVNSIVKNVPTFEGTYPGTSNLRDISNLSKFGNKFIKHSSPLNLSMYSLLDKDSNLVKSIRFAKKEYSKFKRLFFETAEQLGFDGSDRKHVDAILKEITKDKVNTMPFYFSDMVPFGPAITTTITIEDADAQFYALNTPFTLDSLSRRAVTVYINNKQLVHERDYVFNSEGFLQVTVEKQFGDILEINEYETTNGSYIPPTPSKLGLYPTWVPEIFEDDTYGVRPVMIRCHDGSIVRAFNDYRDDLLLELEKRIFNNIKVKYDNTTHDINTYLPSLFRDTAFSRKEVYKPMTTDFIQWLSLVDTDYTNHLYFDRTNTFTFNYSGLKDKKGNALPGWWRGIYKHYFDTDRPHTNPWEMLGFTIKPTWWEEVYGPAPYTKSNLLLWEDLEKGIIREPGKGFKINRQFARPGLTTFIPVDDQGKLLGPSDCNIPLKFSSANIDKDFEFSDNAPVESAWTNSSEFPFALITSWAINSPASLLATGFDRSRQIRNTLGHIVYKPTMDYIKLSDLVFPNTSKDSVNVFTSGLVNYIAGFMAANLDNTYEQYKTNIKSIKNCLAFKVAGFTDKTKFKLILDSRTPLNQGNVFVPEENYQIVLNTSSPLKNINYSGVIVELTASGFVIRGYDRDVPSFNYYRPLSSSTDITINVGGVSEAFVKWAPEKTYAKGTIVSANENYYRVKSTFTSKEEFTTEFLERLPRLPVTGGIDAIFKNRFDTFVVESLPYGTVLPTVQDVVDFLLGYQKWLQDQGFRFEYFNGNDKIISDWKNAAREFMFWNTQNWQEGAVISLSPAADQVYFETDYSVVDNVFDSFYGYSLIKSDGKKLLEDYIKISRHEDNLFKLEPKNTADGIYAIKLPVVQKEHVVIIDNVSVFGDVIYQPATGYRQERIKTFGYRTTDWDGSLNAPGFMYSEIKITEWSQWQDYSLGDIVKYKEFYYIANSQVPGSEYFDYKDWSRLENVPESGLITNFEYKTNQFTDFYDLDTDNFDVEQQQLAQHLIGYQKRTYLENIINDEVSQYKFYQGMIQDKGSRNSLDKMFDVLSAADKESLDFYEEWAIKQGQYGASEGYEEVEFRLDEKQVRLTPQPVLLTNVDNDETDLIYRIKDFEVYRKPKNYNNAPFPVLEDYTQFTRSQGYVNVGDVKYAIPTYDDILDLDIATVDNYDYIWVGEKDYTWDVLQHRIVPVNIIRIETAPTKVIDNNSPYQIKLTLNTVTEEVGVGDVIGIRDVIVVNDVPEDSTDYPINKQEQLLLQGFFKVIKKDVNVIYVNSDQEITLIPECIALITKFISVRASNYTEANVLVQNNNVQSGTKIWVDNNDQNWKVIENTQSYGLLQSIPAEEDGGDNNFAGHIAIDGRNTSLAISSPTAGLDGKIFSYTRGGNSQNFQFSQILEPTAAAADLNKGFGKSAAFSLDGKYLIVGAPDASNVKTRFRGNYDEATDYQNGEIVKYADQLWEVVVDIRGADPAGEFGSFGSIAEVLDKNSIFNNEVSFNNIVTGNYPFENIETDHVLIRAFRDQYDATAPGDTVYYDWYAQTTLNQQQGTLTPRQPFDGAIPEISESFIESGLVIQKKVDVVLYVNSILNIPDLLQQVEATGAFGYVSYIYENEGRATIYIQETSGSWPETGSLFFETGEFVGEYIKVAPVETSSLDTSEDLGGYWYFDVGQTYSVGTVNEDQGRALAVYNIVPQGQPNSGATGSNIYDLNNTVTNIGDNAINSYFRTLTYQGTPGPNGNLNVIPSDLFIVRGPKDLTDQLTVGDEVGLTFFRFPNSNTGTYTDITVTGVTYEQINKKHNLVAKWTGYIDFELEENNPNTGFPLEPKIGQFIRDDNTKATAKVEFFQKFNNSRARVYVSQVQGNFSFVSGIADLFMLSIISDPDPIYQANQRLGNILDVSLGSASLNIGALCVFRLPALIEEVPAQDTVIGAEYIIYRDFTLLGLPTLPNIPATNNLDYKQVFSIPIDPNEGVSNGLNNFGYFSIYKRENVSSLTPVNSFIVPDEIDNLRSASKVKIAKRNDLYKAFIGCAGNGTTDNPGRIYFINNGIDDEGIQYNWEIARDKRYKGEFRSDRDYFIDEVVFFEGYFYKALTNIAGDGSLFIPLEWELITNDQIRSIDYVGYLPNDTGNYPEDSNYKGFFTIQRNYVVGEIVQYFNGDFYRALRNIPINYLGFVDNNGIIEVPEEDWELINFVPGGDSNTAIDRTNLIGFGRDFDVSDNSEVLIVTLDYADGTNKVAVYRNVNDNFQKTQELISPTVLDLNINFAKSISISQDGRLIAVGAPGADDEVKGDDVGAVFIYEQVNGVFTLTQTLRSANPVKGEGFGRKLEFDGQTLYVSAFNASSDDVTTFDSGNTVFDNQFTYFKNEIANNGVVYVYDRIDNQMLFGQTLDYHTYIDRNVNESDLFGRNIAARGNHLYVALPDYVNQDNKQGLLLDYRRNDNLKPWAISREYVAPADLSKIKKMMLYSLDKNEILQQLDYIDPVQGKIAGPADEEIRYKTAIDPATYTHGSNVFVNETSSWGKDQTGTVWWDISTAKFINIYQGNLIYKTNNFNKLAPGASIDVYEWVESTQTPAQWDNLSGTPRGETLGITGKSKYGMEGYSQRRVYDSIAKRFTTYYYFWVKGKTSIPDIPSRSLSIANVASLIEDPSGQGYRFISIFDSNSFALHNCNNLIEGTNTVLNIQYWTYSNELSNIHNQYQIVTEGLGTSKPYPDIVRKLVDSLVGYDEQSRPVPDYNLSPKDKYGILNSPRQGMFVNRTEALKQVIERVNSVCKQNLIVDEKDISRLFDNDPAPSIITGQFDVAVDTIIDLDFIGVIRAQTAVLTPVIENGNVVRVDIVDPGRGYRVPPTYTVTGQGSDLELEFTINALGGINSVTILNQGINYNDNTVINVRPFTALVNSDQNINGKWSLHQKSGNSWQRIASQAYNVPLYWNYEDWYADGYNEYTEINHVIDLSYSLQSLDDNFGDIVKILNVGGDGWLLLEKIDNQDTIDYTVNYKTVGKQNGTIQFSQTLYNYNAGNIGFDNQSFDTAFFDLQPIEETRIILNALGNNILVNDLETEYNNLFFVCLRYAFSEQGYLDWAFKTSFVKAQHNVGELAQSPTFKNDSLSSYEEYINEVKPYKSKIREYVSNYSKLDSSATVVTDFDSPPRYNDITQKITPNDVKVVDGVLFGLGLTSNIDQDWLNNSSYKVIEIQISDPGIGYISAPQIEIEGNATAKASLGVGGKITSVVITNPGSGYFSKPIIKVNGSLSETGRPAVLDAVIGDSPVRNLHTTVKFDRVSGNYFITNLNQTETFAGTGSKTEFDLQWPMDMRTDTVEVFVNGELVLNSNYEYDNYLSANSEYDKYYGKINFVDPPANNTVIEVNYKKSIRLLDAQDRINFFYNPTEGQIGKDLGQLMDGIDYGGIQVKSFDFAGPTGWDSDPWYAGRWDIFDETFDDEVFTTDGSTLVFDLAKPLEKNVKYNVYINGTRVDDNDWDGTSTVTNPYAIMAPIVGDGVTDTFTFENEVGYRQVLAALDSSGENNPPDVTITIRRSTSDGSLKLNEASFDTSLSGGDLAYTTATGLNADDINVDGDGFVTVTTSKGPEELVPGQLMDTLDITVYERPNSGTSVVEVSAFKGDGITTRFALGQRPFAFENVIVKVNYQIVSSPTEYVIDYSTNEIVFTTPPANRADIVLTSTGIGGANILNYGEFITDGISQEQVTGVDFTDTVHAFITVNGKEEAFELIEDNNGKVVVRFTTPPLANRLVQWALFDDVVDSFSKITVDEIVADGSSIAYELSKTPFSQQPTSYYTIVTVNNERVLAPGYSESFIVKENVLQYKMKVWQIPVGTVEGVEIKVFLNNRELEFLQEWTYEGAASFNPNITPDAQEGSTIILNAGVARPGDELTVFILSSGEYRFGYFDSSAEFVDTSGELVPALLTPTITDGVITAVEITNAGRGYTEDSIVTASGVGQDAEFTITVDEVGRITTVNIVNGGSGYELNTVLFVEIVPLPTVIYFDETFAEGDVIRVYQFSNHDGLGIQREKYDVVERTQMTIGTQGYNDFRQLKNNLISLRKEAVSVKYVWISVNGKWLTPTADYVLLEDKKTIRFVSDLKDYDVIDIIHFASPPISNRYGWRQFKDMLNITTYLRLSSDDQYELEEPLNWYDRTITLKGDTSKLPSPTQTSKNPGVLFINGERIEYFRRDGNVLKQLRRGTLGTGIKDQYPAGTSLYNQSTDSIVPYKDTEERYTVTSGTYVDMRSYFANDSIDIKVDSISYSFNNNTVFPVRVPGVYEQVATVTGSGFRPNVEVYMQDEAGQSRMLQKVSSTETEIQFYTETMPVGAYDLVIYNPREEVPAIRAAESLVVTKFLPYVQILLPYEPEAFTDVVKNPVQTGEWYKAPFDEGGIPNEYWQALNIEVFANGRRLRKNPIKVYDETKGQFSPDGDIDVQAEYAVNRNEGAYVRLTEPPEPNTVLTIVRKLGNDWREIESTNPLVFKPLGSSETKVATFLRGKTINLPR